MKTVLNLYKPPGMTPLQLILAFKTRYPEYKSIKMCYAGRLDPLAHGVVLLLADPETKQASQYRNLTKTYVTELLFGISTDSHDMLGLPQLSEVPSDLTRLPSLLTDLQGIHQQAYPIFSSHPVKGKPLFEWARLEKLPGISIPSKQVEVYAVNQISTRDMPAHELWIRINQKITPVVGDFRQTTILEKWNTLLKDSTQSFSLVTVQISCSSGTYIRGIAHTLGEKLGCGAAAFDILRTRVGEYTIESAIRLE